MGYSADNKVDYVISPSYNHASKLYPIDPPAIESGYVYHFTTGSNLLYEVRYAPKADDILGMVVNFTVLGDDFEQDYPVTNRGELYGIIGTVIEIMRMFHTHHNFTKSYEFSGEYKDDEDREKSAASIRSRLYLRYAEKALNNNWKATAAGNKTFLKRIR